MSDMNSIQEALNFSNKTVLVTGGGKGVGLGISKRFLACGANVALDDGHDRLRQIQGLGDFHAHNSVIYTMRF